MITKEAKLRCEAKSMQEQLEDCRRAMQRASGSGDMADVSLHLNHDKDWRDQPPMRMGGAD